MIGGSSASSHCSFSVPSVRASFPLSHAATRREQTRARGPFLTTFLLFSCGMLAPWPTLRPVLQPSFRCVRPSRGRYIPERPPRANPFRAHTRDQPSVHVADRSPSVVGVRSFYRREFCDRFDAYDESALALLRRRNRHELMSHLSKCSVAIKVEKIFAMAVESGFAYCCIWVRTFARSLFL